MKIQKMLARKLAKQYLSEEDLVQLLIESVESFRRTKEEDELMFNDLKKIEGFQEYLSNTLIQDKDRYFAAGSPMEQLLTKGAYNRTLYLRSKLREKKEDKELRLDSPRYA